MRSYDDIVDPKDLVTKDYLIGEHILLDSSNMSLPQTVQQAIEAIYSQISKNTNVDGGDPTSTYSEMINLDGGTP